MFKVLEDKPSDKIKPSPSVINRLFENDFNRPMNIFEFLIMWNITFWYFLFTGLAIVVGAKLPVKWLEIAYAMDRNKAVSKFTSKIAPKINKSITPTPYKVRDVTSDPNPPNLLKQ